MQRLGLVDIPREVALLGLVEAMLSFVAVYTAVSIAGPAGSMPAIAGSLRPSAIGLAAIMTIGAGLGGAALGLYRSEVWLDRNRVLSTTGLAAIAAILIQLVVSHEANIGFSAVPIALFATMLAANLGTMTVIRLAYGCVAGRTRHTRRILLIGEPEAVRTLKSRLRSGRGQPFVPVSLQATEIDWKLVREHKIWAIVVAGKEFVASATGPLLDCKLRGMKVFSSAGFQESLLGRIDLDTVTANDLLTGPGFATTRSGDAAKRALDLILATAMLMATLPLIAVVAMAIKIEDPGPVFSRHRRIGRFDQPFALFRFRAITTSADPALPRAMVPDVRLTRVGRFIRATRIEELPQLMNVIRGDLSLVGPRAERPQFANHLTRTVRFFRQRTYVRPGLTGWAQINAPYGAPVKDVREMLSYDLYYVKNRSIITDAFILLLTMRRVLSGKGRR